MMNDYSDGVMVALLPIKAEWSSLDMPHMTLVYAGIKSELRTTAYNDIAKDAWTIATTFKVITLSSMGTDIFGKDDEKVNVLRLRMTKELMEMRKIVERWNKSEYAFNPHVTVGAVGAPTGDLPQYVAFDRILVAYGDDKQVFHLQTK